MEPSEFGICHSECVFLRLAARGDHCGFIVTGERPTRLRLQTQEPAACESTIRRAFNAMLGIFTSIASAYKAGRHKGA
jgi:hypothetical protein